ncbi:MAG: prolipoprotein diacylglyceryl transferase family protein [Thermodesulfobacteriota bacterium]|nr:prolipoprotein diacylglyceryl transferase family protein [Thermodesulfobacteriota bacterium]
MANFVFILCLAGLLSLLFHWSFKHLPQERWQILGAVPRIKRVDGTWQGVNLTYYGLLTANACIFAAILAVVLLASAKIQTMIIFLITAMVFSVCVPASRLIARLVEHKPFTSSVGGAFFVGLLLIPWLLLLVQYIFKPWTEMQLPVMTVLAAIGIAYAFGEGIGRLACISFGCCYGKPVTDLTPFSQKLMKRFCFVYSGATKKISYADGLDGKRVVPVPAFTVLICCLTGLIGIALFLNDRQPEAFLLTVWVTQIWRVVSEFLRADYRGSGKITKYQIMAAIGVIYAIGLNFVFEGAVATNCDIIRGLTALWHPAIIIFFQVLWLGIFLHAGKSKVTEAVLSFHVIKEHI